MNCGNHLHWKKYSKSLGQIGAEALEGWKSIPVWRYKKELDIGVVVFYDIALIAEENFYSVGSIQITSPARKISTS